jgi:hypothetical protein
MTPQQIAADIERGREIKDEIAKLQAELKQINARLQAAAEKAEHQPLADADREGKQAILRSGSRSLPVIFEADLLIASFKPDSDKHTELTALLADKLPLFFKDTRVFERIQEDGQKFRKFARETLPPDDFAKLIKACLDIKKDGIPKSRVVVDWDGAKPIQQTAAESAA